MDNLLKEDINRIKLMMKYDLRETNKENIKKIIKESQTCSNNITLDEIKKMSEEISNTVKYMDYIFVRMGYVEERAKSVFESVKKLQGKNVYDDISEQCKPAMQLFETFYKKYSSGWLIGKGKDFKLQLEELMKGYYEDKPEATRYLKGAIDVYTKELTRTSTGPEDKSQERQNNINYNYCGQQNGVITANGRHKGIAWAVYKDTYEVTDAEEQIAKNSCGSTPNPQPEPKKQSYPPCQPGQYKLGCSADAVRQVQKCFYTLRADGKFGPRTQAALAAVDKKYSDGFTDSDIQTICSKAPKRPQTTNTNQKTTTTKKTDQFYDVEDGSQEITQDDLP